MKQGFVGGLSFFSKLHISLIWLTNNTTAGIVKCSEEGSGNGEGLLATYSRHVREGAVGARTSEVQVALGGRIA